jgi:electron transfer flavoprotein alpha subunit
VLPDTGGGTGAPVWVVAEMDERGPKPVTAELLTKAAQVAAVLGAPVHALVIGASPGSVDVLAAAGADRVLIAAGAGLVPYTTDAHAAVLSDAIPRAAAGAPRLHQLRA